MYIIQNNHINFVIAEQLPNLQPETETTIKPFLRGQIARQKKGNVNIRPGSCVPPPIGAKQIGKSDILLLGQIVL